MLDLTSAGLILDGFGVIISGGCDSEGNVYQPFVLTDNGLEGMVGVTVLRSNAAAYYCQELTLVDGINHTVTGTRNPAKGTVYITPKDKIDKENFAESIYNGAIATMDTDADGNFTFEGIAGSNGNIYVWSPTSISYATMTGGLSCGTTSPGGGGNTPGEPTGDYVVGTDFTVSSEYDNNVVTIHGTCPTDMQHIYVSANAFDGVAPSTVIYQTTCAIDNGTFTAMFGNATEPLFNGVTYCVWGYTNQEDGEIAITSIECSDSGVCLSGDTLITMADGSDRRMDEIQVGDLVMSQHGEPTIVEVASRGLFNTHHILYTFENGTVIDETHAHRFYNVEQGFWQNLEKWEIGEHAVTIDGLEVALLSKEVIHERAEMFGIWTESGSYYANGLLSGLAKCNQPLVEDASAEKAIDMMTSLAEHQLLELLGLEGLLP